MRAPQISCSFSGHRPEKLPWGDNERDERCLALKAAMDEMVRKAYDDGYRHFICGMARGCDTYFCEVGYTIIMYVSHLGFIEFLEE